MVAADATLYVNGPYDATVTIPDKGTERCVCPAFGGANTPDLLVGGDWMRRNPNPKAVTPDQNQVDWELGSIITTLDTKQRIASDNSAAILTLPVGRLGCQQVSGDPGQVIPVQGAGELPENLAVGFEKQGGWHGGYAIFPRYPAIVGKPSRVGNPQLAQ